MKRFLLYLTICLMLAACGTSPAHAANAQSIQFLLSQVRNASGPLAGGKVYAYEPGTVTPKTIWSDRGATAAITPPCVLDSNGTAQVYGDGLYRFVIKTAAGTTVYDRDNIPVNGIQWYQIRPSGGDDTAAFASAVASGLSVKLLDGATYHVTSLAAVPKRLSGSATIQLTVRNNDWILINTDNTEWQDVTIDANYLATRAVIIDHANHVKLKSVTVKNVQQFSDSTSTVDAIRVKDDCNDVLFEDCTVSTVVGYDNTVIGDTLGAARGIHIENVAVSGTSVSNIRIHKCNFDHIGSREDGDSIALQGFTTSTGTTISECYFTNIGKRAVKILSPGVKVVNNRMFSDYAGTGADVNLYLYSFVSVYASDVEVTGNVGRGGSVQLALDIGTPSWGISNITATGNKWLQDSGDNTYSIGTRYIATVDHSAYADNVVRGMGEGLTLTGAITAVGISDNTFDTVTTASGTSGMGIRLGAYLGDSPSDISVGKNYVNVSKYGLLIQDASANVAYGGGLYGTAPFGFLSDVNSAVIPIQTGVQQIRTPASAANPVMIYNTAGTPVVQMTNAGEVNAAGAVYTGSLRTASAGNTLTLQTSRSYSSAANAVKMVDGTFSNSTGNANPVLISPTYNQTSVASASDLIINRTETAVGSGTQRLISAGTGGGSFVEKFGVSNTGIVNAGGGSANHAICWKPDGKTLGYCSVLVAADGTCGTCN